MLVVVPYLIRHPGTTVGEAAAMFDADAGHLRRDLELLQMSGLPPYLPGDLIEVDIDEDEAVWIRMAEQFARPLRLTRQEAVAVRLRASELLATPGLPEAPDLASALAKLETALGDPPAIGAAEPKAPPAHLGTLRSASRDHKRLRLSYVNAAGERSDRTVEPEAVFAGMGNWYAAVWDIGADQERLLRVDRILECRETDEVFEPRGLEGAGRPLYAPGPDDVAVRLRLGPTVRWAAEYYATTDLLERSDGGVEATLPARDLGGVARLLLRLGPAAEVVEPSSLRGDVVALARATLARYDAS